MKRHVKNRHILRLLSAIICFVFGVVSSIALQSCPPRVATQEHVTAQAYEHAKVKDQAYKEGRREAEFDISRDRLAVRTYGGPVPVGPDLYAERLSHYYGITTVRVAGCVVSNFLMEKTRGYNDTMLPVIESRYGKGILERVRQQAVAEWQGRDRMKEAYLSPRPRKNLLQQTRR